MSRRRTSAAAPQRPLPPVFLLPLLVLLLLQLLQPVAAHAPFRAASIGLWKGPGAASADPLSRRQPLQPWTLPAGGAQSAATTSSRGTDAAAAPRGGGAVKQTARFAADEADYEREVATAASASVNTTTRIATTEGYVQQMSAEVSVAEQEDPDTGHKKIAKTLKNRNNLNLRRKVLHAAFGLTFALLNHVVPRHRFLPGMALLSGATLLMELLRYRRGFGWMNDALHFCLGSSLRKHEMDGKFTGSFYFFTGVTLTAYLYPGSAATLGIAQLALADPSASYFGRQTRHIYWSRIENGLGGIGRNKGWLGFLGGALFCLPFNAAVLYRAVTKAAASLPATSTGPAAVGGAALLLGFAGALADLAVPTPALVMPKRVLGIPVAPFHVDDNMVVPVFSAFACRKIFQLYGWPADLPLAKWLVL